MTIVFASNLSAKSVSSAVGIYMQHKVRQLAERKKYNRQVKDMVTHYLSTNANDTFLWVALVCQNLETISHWDTLKKFEKFPPGLDSLYARMIGQIHSSGNADL
jgi:hypothetical protein